ncbi:MAG: outer membrane beta-barrel domain-containing protein [Oligoflexia bacterium]|nr:outer membrane beta-barrel domain-containing protein [Oligoflexia bacterium]
MKIYWFFLLLIFCFPLLSFSDFEKLGKNTEILDKKRFHFSSANLKVVQKRWLEKRFSSSADLSWSPILKGFNYMNSYSVDLSYRWFISNYFSLNLRYSYYDNPINQDGKDEINLRGRTPLELKYYNKQSYLAGVEWYPFYGKAVLYNQLAHFDLYLSALAGQVELSHQEKNVPIYSLAMGVAQWWHKHFNTRIEAQAFYYKYRFSSKDENREVHEYFYKISVSAGVLF